MLRHAAAEMRFHSEGLVRAVFSIGVADGYDATESLVIEGGGRRLQPEILREDHGTRLQVVDLSPGDVHVRYEVEVRGEVEPQRVDDLQAIRYLRPSRYCESDTLRATALAEFAGQTGEQLLASVSSWVGTRLAYVSGSSKPTDGAVQTLLDRRGVCRDYAHLVIALLRALEVPARMVAVYAPGLDPMDFHAVAEAAIGDTWRVVDATTLAPRSSLLRIATGRDAADTAWLTTHGADIVLDDIQITAVADVLPNDDVTKLASIG